MYRGYAWEGEVLNSIEDRISDLKYITVYRETFKSLAYEQDANVLSVIPLFGVTSVFMSIFLTVTSMSTDWVRSKPWASTLGMLCATLGTLAGVGLLCYLGIPFIGVNAAVPFIMLGKSFSHSSSF